MSENGSALITPEDRGENQHQALPGLNANRAARMSRPESLDKSIPVNVQGPCISPPSTGPDLVLISSLLTALT